MQRAMKMDAAEQRLADDRARAEIANLNAEISEIVQNMRYHFWVLAAAYIGALVVLLKFVG